MSRNYSSNVYRVSVENYKDLGKIVREVYNKQKKTVEVHYNDCFLPVAFFGKYDVIKEQLDYEFHSIISYPLSDIIMGIKYDKVYVYSVNEAENGLYFAGCVDVKDKESMFK